MLKIIMQADWRPDSGEANLEWIVPPVRGREIKTLQRIGSRERGVETERELGAF